MRRRRALSGPECRLRSMSELLPPTNTSLQVRDNVAAVLQGLGVEPSPAAEAEAAALADVQRILEPVQGVTWNSGLPENN